MQWHKEMLRGFRDNMAYEVGRYVILLIWPFAFAGIYTGLSWLGTTRWDWRVNGGLLLIAVIILGITSWKIIRQPHLFVRNATAAGIKSPSHVSRDRIPRTSMLFVILVGGIVGALFGGAIAGLAWKIGTAHRSAYFTPDGRELEPLVVEKEPLQAKAREESPREEPEEEKRATPDWIAFARPPPSPPPFAGIGPLFSKPTFPAGTETFVVSVMGQNRPPFSISELKKKKQQIGTDPNIYPFGNIYIKNEILCIDATMVGGVNGVRVRGNQYELLPAGWDTNSSDEAFEIINEKGIPVYQLRLVQPTVVEISGAFLCDGGNKFLVPNEVEGRAPWAAEIEKLRDQEKDGQVIPAYPIRTKRIFKYPGYRNRGKFEE